MGGAARGKAIIILNPAEPPLIMRDTVFCLIGDTDHDAVAASIASMAERVAKYVPGYRLKQNVQFTAIGADEPIHTLVADRDRVTTRVSVFLEVEGAAHYLPAYAGNLDIMTSAAVQVAETIAQQCLIADAGREMSPHLYIQDVTLRDGMHAIRHRIDPTDVGRIAAALDAAGVDAIEVAHGDGLAGGSVNYGPGSNTDWEWIEAAADSIRNAVLTRLLLPGIGTIAELKQAADLGVRSVRVATHCTEADISAHTSRPPVNSGWTYRDS